jgi:hypothetical protein
MRCRADALRVIAVCSTLLPAGCGPGQDGAGSAGAQPITGTERFGWDQAAADLTELASFRFALYVDNARVQATDVTCGATAGTAGFPCTSSLPSLSAGTHTLAVAAYLDDAGTTRESEKSIAVRVVKR